MANDKSVFKYLVCDCGYKKTDPTGKAKANCKNCGLPMRLTENWYTRITHNGKTTVRAHSPRKRDAEDFISACKVAKRAGNLLPGEENDTTWEKAAKNVEQWWKDAVVRNEIRQSTADFYGWNMIPLNDYFSRFTLLSIGKKDILDYQTSRVKDGVTNTTINHELTTLRRVYSLHLDRTTPEVSPKLFTKHQDISRVKKLENDTEEVRFMTAEEAKSLLAACTPTVRLAVLLGLNTGLRQANVLGMQWKQVDLKERLIKLPGRRNKNRKAHQVDIPQHLLAELKEWKRKTGLTGHLFPNPNYKPEEPDSCRHLDRHDIRTDFEKAVKAAGLEGLTFHCTRHTFASQFLMNDGDIATLSDLLDHSDISITKKVYGHLSREYKRQAVDNFAESFLAQLS